MARRFILLALLVTLLACGCVRRRMTVRTNPPGATVWIDDHEIGQTPVSTSFTYYGTRKFRIEKDGFETIVVNQRVDAPWYQVPPLDFVSETLVPNELRDEREIAFDLIPKATVAVNEVLRNADQLRDMANPAARDDGYGVYDPAPNVPWSQR